MIAIVRGSVIGTASALLLGASLAFSSWSVVSAESQTHRDGSITCSKGGNAYCLTVKNTSSGNAIEGTAADDTGVVGVGFSGVYGAGTGSNGVGVYGTNNVSTGVYGTSNEGTGVYGNSGNGDGVYGFSSTTYGGVFESDSSGNGSGGSPALEALADASDGYLLYAYNSQTEGSFLVDPDGDGGFTGSVSASEFYKNQDTRGGPQVEAFSPESTRATIEDTGTTRLESGQGSVRFDSAFASTIDAARGYQVFLTPNGETRGWLYVSAKYEGGFIVREAEHGRSSIYFDYRVVAHPYGASDAELPRLEIKRLPIPHTPRHAQPPQP